MFVVFKRLCQLIFHVVKLGRQVIQVSRIKRPNDFAQPPNKPVQGIALDHNPWECPIW
nr:hypothetical protein [Hydrogenophaga palleronii]